MAESISKPEAGDFIIEGIDAFLEETGRLKSHQKKFVTATFKNIFPVILKVVASGGVDTSSNVRDIPSEENLRSTFETCGQEINPELGYFIAYDFGYYCAKNNYRDMIVMISYIPENLNIIYFVSLNSSVVEQLTVEFVVINGSLVRLRLGRFFWENI